MVLVPWIGMAYMTAGRIDHDQSELEFSKSLQPAIAQTQLLAAIERNLYDEGGSASLIITFRAMGLPIALAEKLSGVPIRADLVHSRENVDRAILQLHSPLGIDPQKLRAVRDRFDSPSMKDPFDSGYNELRAANRDALASSLRDLSILAALLGGDPNLTTEIRALELTINAAQASIEESNLLLHRLATPTLDDFGINQIQRIHGDVLRPLRNLATLGSSITASAANQLLLSDDQATINSYAIQPTITENSSSTNSIEATKVMYGTLSRRNARVGEIVDLAANSISARAKFLIDEQRTGINDTIIWLFVSLAGTLVLAALVAREISRPLRRLAQQALALVDGHDRLSPLPLTGPRELSVSAQAINELATTLHSIQQQADQLASGQPQTVAIEYAPTTRLGQSVHQAVERLSESIQSNNKLRDDFAFAATHDALTGLPNRAAVYQLLEEQLSSHADVGLLFIDLDHFKSVNDLEGHQAGDEVLQVMAHRFDACAGSDQVVARIGGDEFVVVCGGDVSQSALSDLADRIGATALLPVEIGAAVLLLGASIGIAIAQPTDTVSTLLRQADEALYRAKNAGRNQTVLS
jgi:diguanylate cyclase (GGDEF)-like protein